MDLSLFKERQLELVDSASLVCELLREEIDLQYKQTLVFYTQ